ncbi:uncharacterized protein LOC115884289 [Sitophilus oryzae]|uniref:Uncharacterized protein LOC115884289 n=1 Tax=Sitophilus oryzae TaxID=7048 RepID=A0A6J2Y6T7_SITOR|nr:uncharacterized protein LOC115884289 [Sitophilus oryzae]
MFVLGLLILAVFESNVLGFRNHLLFAKRHPLYASFYTDKLKQFEDTANTRNPPTTFQTNLGNFADFDNGADLPNLDHILENTSGNEARFPDFNLVSQQELASGLIANRPTPSPSQTLVTGNEFVNDLLSQNSISNSTNSRNVRQNSNSSVSTQSPFRFHIDTEEGSSKTEETGGGGNGGNVKIESRKPALNLPKILPGFSAGTDQKPSVLGLFKTGLNTAQKTAQNVGNFARSEFQVLGDATRETSQNFGFGRPLSGLLSSGLSSVYK